MCRTALLTALLVVLMAAGGPLRAEGYDVLELPAVKSPLAAKSQIFAINKFGDRYFATGHRGHILYSDDGGDSWTQAEVPVRSSLLDVHFPTPELGWAVGHEGVILHSSDAGKTWVKQYDGLRYGNEGLAFYKALLEQEPDNEYYDILVGEMEFAIEQGADKPFFRVYFVSPTQGYAMGAYGMSVVTFDAGKNWEHNLHRFENDGFYHVFDFARLPGPGRFFLSGEAGLFMVGDVKERTGKRVHSVPWEGSFFTSSAASDGAIVMGGLRGRMFRTEDVGDTWTVVEKPPTSSIVGSTRLEDGRLVFVGIAGEVLMSEDDGHSFAVVPVSSGDRIYAVAEGPTGTLLVGGPRGINKLTLP
jgi:photosystem II stability/assembly factor-like uncharacterized protein